MNAETAQIIAALRKNHRVVCGTNTIQSHYQNHIERGDYTLFDQTYASNILGVSKPNPEFWRLILTAENVQPNEAFFIDDKKENTVAASSLGINTHTFTTAAELQKAVSKWL